MNALKFTLDLQRMEQEAASAGLWLTRRALNIVIKVIGWEMAGNPTMAARCLPPPEQDEYVQGDFSRLGRGKGLRPPKHPLRLRDR